jgi:hypothetical protein
MPRFQQAVSAIMSKCLAQSIEEKTFPKEKLSYKFREGCRIFRSILHLETYRLARAKTLTNNGRKFSLENGKKNSLIID